MSEAEHGVCSVTKSIRWRHHWCLSPIPKSVHKTNWLQRIDSLIIAAHGKLVSPSWLRHGCIAMGAVNNVVWNHGFRLGVGSALIEGKIQGCSKSGDGDWLPATRGTGLMAGQVLPTQLVPSKVAANEILEGVYSVLSIIVACWKIQCPTSVRPTTSFPPTASVPPTTSFPPTTSVLPEVGMYRRLSVYTAPKVLIK